MIRGAAAHPGLLRVATRLRCKRGSPDQVGRAWLRRLSVRGMSSAACSQVCAGPPELPGSRQCMFYHYAAESGVVIVAVATHHTCHLQQLTAPVATGLQLWAAHYPRKRSLRHEPAQLCVCEPEAGGARCALAALAHAGPLASSGCSYRITSGACTGHVLVSPKRVVPRFQALSPDEVADLWCAALRQLPCPTHARGVLSMSYTCLHVHRELARARCLQPGGAQALTVSLPLRRVGRRVLAQRVGGVVEPHFGATSLTLTVQVTGPLPRRPCPPAGPCPSRYTPAWFGILRHTPCEEHVASGAPVHVCPPGSWAGNVGRTKTDMSCMCCCGGDGAWCASRSGMLTRHCTLSCHGGGMHAGACGPRLHACAAV
jgi:hypothetical protein